MAGEPDATTPDCNQLQTVQVRIVGGGDQTYDYAWAGPQPLAPGDWVTLPPNVVSKDGGLGRVASTKPPTWKGRLKHIVAKTDKPDPWAVRFAAVRSKPEARRLWDRARRDPAVTADKLDEYVAIGQDALRKLGVKLLRDAVDYDRQGDALDIPSVDPAAEERAWAQRGSTA